MSDSSVRRAPRAVVAALGLAALLATSSAFASAQRTFVASTGNDANAANNCSIVLPCRSFAVAMAQTLNDGEIIVLDSAGYAPVVIDRSISIIASAGLYAGITAFSGDAINITGDGLRVLLRGLDVNGLGGIDGLHLQTTSSEVRLEHVTISGFSQAGIDMMFGNSFGSRLYVDDSVIRANQNGIIAAGIVEIMLDRVRIQENAVYGVQIATMPSLRVRDSVIERNGSIGVYADTFGMNGASMALTVSGSAVRRNGIGIRIQARQSNAAFRIAMMVSNTDVSKNAGVGVEVSCLDVSVAVATIADSTLSDNGADGLTGAGAGCTLNASHNVIAGNVGTSMVNSGAGSFATFGDNRVRSNGTDTPSGTITAVAPK